jgi:FlaA1/EpsC-like NDP-sugar epimerase
MDSPRCNYQELPNVYHIKMDNSRWSLQGMTALLTGGAGGIGHAIVEELAGFGPKSMYPTYLKHCSIKV